MTKNVFFSLISQLIFYLTPLIVAPYLSRVLGPDCIGQYNFAYSYIYYFSSLITLGFGILGIKIISNNKNNKTDYSRQFWTIWIIKSMIGIFVLLTFFLMCMFKIFGDSLNYGVMFCLMLVLFGNILDSRYLFQGLGNFKIISLLQFVTNLSYMIFIFLFVKNVDDLIIYTLLKSSIDLATNVILLFKSFFLVERMAFDKKTAFELIKQSVVLSIPNFLMSCGVQLNQTFLGYLASNEDVAFYQQAIKFHLLIGQLTFAISPVMLSYNSSLDSENSKEIIKDKTTKMINFSVFLSAPISFGLISIASIFIPLYLGDSFSQVVNLIYVIAPFSILSPLSSLIIHSYFYSFNKNKKILVITIFELLVNVLIGIFTIYWLKLGAIGACVTTAICELFLFICCAASAKEILGYKKIFIGCGKILLSSILMLGTVFLVNYFAINKINNVLLLLIDILTGGLIYIVMLLITKEFNIYYLINKIKKIKIK